MTGIAIALSLTRCAPRLAATMCAIRTATTTRTESVLATANSLRQASTNRLAIIATICDIFIISTDRSKIMRWAHIDERQPKQGQWVVIYWNGIFKSGQFDARHPFGYAVVDYQSGKYWNGFARWAAISTPKS